MKIKNLYILLCLLSSPTTMPAKDLVWYNGQGTVNYSVCDKPGTVVDIALQMFNNDMKAVTGHQATKRGDAKIEIWQLDALNDKEFSDMAGLHLPYQKIITKKDAFYIGIRNNKIEIIGSNGRGTAYGILELSRLAGVSPWIYWGDVVPEKKNKLTIDNNFETLQFPSVEYRGIFINDEDWTNRVWSNKKLDPKAPLGAMGPHYYKKIFELLLRLRGNAIWPAMHSGTKAFFTIKGNKETADSCDIFIGSSHCEPILRNNLAEWSESKMGPYNYITNRKQVESYWEGRAKETIGMEALYTIGMRGIHDGSMQGVKTMEEKVSGLQSVIDYQRKLLSKTINKNITQIPQVFIPYKEVLDIYEHGLKVPDDVILMWCDDNYGYMTRLSDTQQQLRKGGGGVYYHLSYWGRPHDWLWLTTIQPGLIYNEMRTAYDHNAKRLWIANVHDPKVAAYDLNLFMDMAWNINSVKSNTIQNHLGNWLVQQFGTKAGRKLLPAMTEFYHLTGIRRPEFMGWNQVELDKNIYDKGWSPVTNTEFNADEFGNELELYLNKYEDIKETVSDVEKIIRPELKDAFFAAIKYPVFASAAMATKELQSQEARHIGRIESFHHDSEALEPAVRSWKAYEEIQSLTNYYNKEMAGGKWDGNMDMAPRGLNVFNAPTLPDKLTAEEIKKYSYYGNQSAKLDDDDCIVRNAYDWTTASLGATPIEMLGHSMKAVSLPKNDSIKYYFETKEEEDTAVIRIAAIPTQANDKGDIRFSVSIDDATPIIFSLKEPYRSEDWKQNVLRGQALRTIPLRIAKGKHCLEIKALDDHIIIDQWMLDYDIDRKFYVFPINE